jgi:hypothetical protein
MSAVHRRLQGRSPRNVVNLETAVEGIGVEVVALGLVELQSARAGKPTGGEAS